MNESLFQGDCETHLHSDTRSTHEQLILKVMVPLGWRELCPFPWGIQWWLIFCRFLNSKPLYHQTISKYWNFNRTTKNTNKSNLLLFQLQNSDIERIKIIRLIIRPVSSNIYNYKMNMKFYHNNQTENR